MRNKNGINRALTLIGYLFPAIVALLFTCFLSLKIGNNFLAVHDSPLFFNLDKLQSQIGLLWNPNNFGYPSYVAQAMNYFSFLLNELCLDVFKSVKTGQLVLYFIYITSIWYASWYSFYALLHGLKIKSPKINSLIGSYFYTFNLYMITSWHGGTIDSLFLCYAICPLLLLEVFKLFSPEDYQSPSIFTAIAFGLSSHASPVFFSVLICFFAPLFVIALVARRWDILKNSSKFLIISFFVSLAFTPLFAFFIFYNEPFPLDGSATSQPISFLNIGVSGLFKLYFDWTINGYWNGRYFHSYYPYFQNGIIALSALGLWLLTFFIFFKGIRDKKIGYFFLWVIFAIGLGFFLAKATQPPFSLINQWLYDHVPFFAMFRTPGTKFGLAIICLYSFGISYSLSQLCANKIKYIIY
jgi:hypothetical protein